MKLGKCQHFKGGLVEVVAVAHHSETLKEMVVHKCLYESRSFGKGSVWVCPKQMFLENVIIVGKDVPRFKPVNN